MNQDTENQFDGEISLTFDDVSIDEQSHQINQPNNDVMNALKRNQDKWRAAKEYAEKNGFEFLVMNSCWE